VGVGLLWACGLWGAGRGVDDMGGREESRSNSDPTGSRADKCRTHELTPAVGRFDSKMGTQRNSEI
jgi:hypothetical protein